MMDGVFSSEDLLDQRLEVFGGEGEALWLAHANGYPPGSYQAFIDKLTPHYSVTGYKHRPMWAKYRTQDRLSWSQFADDMIQTLEVSGKPSPWVVGHSMGATIAVIAAAKRPDLFRGLVLMDPVFMRSRRVLALRLMPETQKRKMPMVSKTLKRPALFSSREEAYNFHRERRAFARFSDEVLWDYINAGTRSTDDDKFELAFSPEWEAAIYTSVPWIWPAVKRIKVPMLVLRGQDSDVFTQSMLSRVLLLQSQAELQQSLGGHLLPMEYPDATADTVLAFLQQHDGVAQESAQDLSA